jgi:hypothetical protein
MEDRYFFRRIRRIRRVFVTCSFRFLDKYDQDCTSFVSKNYRSSQQNGVNRIGISSLIQRNKSIWQCIFNSNLEFY